MEHGLVRSRCRRGQCSSRILALVTPGVCGETRSGSARNINVARGVHRHRIPRDHRSLWCRECFGQRDTASRRQRKEKRVSKVSMARYGLPLGSIAKAWLRRGRQTENLTAVPDELNLVMKAQLLPVVGVPRLVEVSGNPVMSGSGDISAPVESPRCRLRCRRTSRLDK